MPARYLKADSYEVAASFLGPFDQAFAGRDQLTRMIHNEFRLRLPELLMMRVDKITMANSLEARVPFLDHHLVEFTMDVPMAMKIKSGETKHLLKKAVAGIIPDDIIHRKKMGFSAPMADWLRGEFGARAEERILGSPLMEKMGFDKNHVATLIKDHRGGRRDTSWPVWILYNLTAWQDHWIGTGDSVNCGHQRNGKPAGRAPGTECWPTAADTGLVRWSASAATAPCRLRRRWRAMARSSSVYPRRSTMTFIIRT